MITDHNSLKVELENYRGFNAISQLVIIPETEYNNVLEDVQRLVDSNTRSMSFEAELDVFGPVILQTERSYPDLSAGKLITLSQLPISYQFDLEKRENLKLNVSGVGLNSSQLWFNFTNTLTGEITKYNLPDEKVNHVIDLMVKKEDGVVENKMYQHEGLLQSYHQLELGDLPKGDYTLAIQVDAKDYQKRQLASLKQLKKLYTGITPREVEEKDDEEEHVCCHCSALDPLLRQDLNDQVDWTVVNKNTCNWHILQAPVISLKNDDEFYFNYTFQKKNVKDFHQKVIYLDENNVELSVEQIDQLEIEPEDQKITKSALLDPPKDAKKFVFLIYFKGVYKTQSKVTFYDFSIHNHTRLPALDFMMISQNKESQLELLPAEANKLEHIKTRRSKKWTFEQSSKHRLFKSNQPYHKVWTHEQEPLISYGIFHSVNIGPGKTFINFSLSYMHLYYFGLFIFTAMLIYIIINVLKRD